MTPQHGPSARARVLILDDDEDLALCLHDTLELRHHDVRVATNLDTARRELAAEAPDVFIVDLFIGTRSSVGLLETVRKTLPWVRCVLISGSEPRVWNHLVEQGIVETALKKPFWPDELIALVEDACGRDGERRAAR
jgi:DNA-binding NtrC family response regulator